VLEVELAQQLLDTCRQGGDAIEQSEAAQILRNRQIAGQRRIHGRKIRACERERTALVDVDIVDLNVPRGCLKHAQHHIDRGRLAGAVGAQQAHDFAAPNLE
jgi:hypothetical protein